MITREQTEAAFGDDKEPYQTKNIDHKVTAINLLRSRIPYDECKGIIAGSEHDVLYLCDIEMALPFLDEEDLKVLADCNVCADWDIDCFFLFT